MVGMKAYYNEFKREREKNWIVKTTLQTNFAVKRTEKMNRRSREMWDQKRFKMEDK